MTKTYNNKIYEDRNQYEQRKKNYVKIADNF